MANQLNASGAISLAGTTAGQSIQTALNGSGSSQISFNTVGVLALKGTTSSTNIVMPTDFYSKIPPTSRAIFAFGNTVIGTTGSPTAVSNLVSTAGVIASNTSGVGTARNNVAACGYGFDKGIFGFGFSTALTGVTNLISNAGVVATDTAAVGTARRSPAATGYGVDLGVFFGGYTTIAVDSRNLVSNVGVVASTTSATGVQARQGCVGVRYGTDTGFIFGGRNTPTGTTYYNTYNRVNNTGTVGVNQTTAGATASDTPGAASYGFDKAIIQGGNGGGSVTGKSNLIGNTGSIANDVTAVLDSTFLGRAGSSYGFTGQGVIAFGASASAVVNTYNNISNTGVVAVGVASAGTARQRLGCCGFGVSQS